jgi:hypothetical protein
MRWTVSLLCFMALAVFYSPGKVTDFQCGPAPMAPKCNVPKCTVDGWKFWPVERGKYCETTEGPGICDGGELGPPEQIEPNRQGKCIVTFGGSLSPLYYVLHVVYSPPGTSGSGPKSTVTYADGSTLSTETKTKSSFKSELSVIAEANILGFTPLSANTGYATSKDNEEALKVSKAQQTTVEMAGGSADGIDHDRDTIYLWINPVVNVSGAGDQLNWTLGIDGSTMEIQHVHVGWLKAPTTMPPGVAQALQARGITPADFPTILLHAPFASGSTTIDTSRFVQTTTSFPYEPPFAQGEPPNSYSLRVENQTITSHGSSRSHEYKVGLRGTLGPGPQPLVAKLVVSTQFTWTKSTSITDANTSTQSATVKVTGPSFGYLGPTNLAVYYDTLYNTFMFAPIVTSPTLAGFVRDSDERAVRHQEVVLTVNGVRHRTVTGRDGQYRFFGDLRGDARLTTRDIDMSINLNGPAMRQNLTPAEVLKKRKPKTRNN